MSQTGEAPSRTWKRAIIFARLFPVSSRPERSEGDSKRSDRGLKINPALALKYEWFILDDASESTRRTNAMAADTVTPRRLKHLAEAMGCQTQQDLARALGITQATGPLATLRRDRYGLARGIFVDQRWVDLVPGMFQGVQIVRDPGYNVAYWNLSHRKVTGTEPDYQVSGAPLCFFHFSGYDPDQPDQLSRHQNRHRIGSLPRATEEIVRGYHDELLSAGFLTCRKWPNGYGSFQNGTRIPDLGRAIHHEAPELLEHIADPFSEQGFRAFLNVWNSPVEDGTATRPSISRLAYRIYRTRTDVQSAMPDIFGANYKRFLEWMLVSGKAEHGLGDVFLTSVADAIQCVKNFQGTSAAPVLATENAFTDKPIGLDPISVNGTSRLRLTRLAVAIYESRAELQRYFPDPCGRDSARFLVWLLTYGKKEHHLSPLHLAPMKAQWRTVVNMQPTMASRLRYEATLRAFAASVVVRAALARLGPLGKGLSRTQPRSSGEANSARNSAPRSLEFGVNLVGYFQSETGVGQSVRAAYGALAAANVRTSRRPVYDPGLVRKQDHGLGPASTACPYSHSLFYVNADQTHAVRRGLGGEFYRERRNIGYWTWELDTFPDRWAGAFEPYHEIWTPSSFCRDAVALKAPKPVFRVPYAVAPETPAGMDRQHFGLAPDRFIFLYAFDVLSVPERKNPIAAVRAFQGAFPAGSRCQLVIKINHSETRPTYVEELRAACTSGAVRIFDSALSRSEMYALTRCADCILSLHRSEGFGLLIAEGMYFGKPAIATNYSGNTDFTRPDNSLLVDYHLVPVGRGCEPYDADSLWAEPDIEQAARHISAIATDPDLRARLSAAGSEFVRSNLSAEAVGRQMRDRLEASGQASSFAGSDRPAAVKG